MNTISAPGFSPLEHRVRSTTISNINNGETKDSSTPTSTLTISGKSLMYSRLFNTTDLAKNINVETRIGSSDVDKISYFEYLTKEDLITIESAYEYAAKSNTDLRYVDDFSADLGAFRKYGEVPVGDIYTSDGRKITNDFSASDKVIANRILGSDEIKSTKIDSAFLNRILDGSRPAHATNFEFLEHLVSVFSANGIVASTDKFVSFKSNPNNFVTKIAAEVNSDFIIEEPDLIKIDGKGYIKNPKKDSVSDKNYVESIDFNVISKYFDAMIKNDAKGSLTDQSGHSNAGNTLSQKMWKLLVG